MLQVGHVHIGHSTGHGEFLLRTETGYHDFVDCIGDFLLHGDVVSGLTILDKDFLSLETNEREDEGLIFSDLDFIVTVDIGDGSKADITLHGDAHTDERLTGIVDNRTGHFNWILCQSTYCDAQQHDECQYILFHNHSVRLGYSFTPSISSSSGSSIVIVRN